MEKKKAASNTCNHCGGMITFNGEYDSCLMCGRSREHLCEYCMNRAGVSEAKPAKRARSVKATK